MNRTTEKKTTALPGSEFLDPKLLLYIEINIAAALPLTTMRHCRSSPCGIAAHQNAALPLMSFAIIYMRHCRLCGWMDEANGVPTLRLHTEAPRHRGTETPRHRETETPRHRDTETLRNRDTETQRHREWWGRLLLFLPLLPRNGINVHARPTWR